MKEYKYTNGIYSFDMNPGFTFRVDWVCKKWVSIVTGYDDLHTKYYYFDDFTNIVNIYNGVCQYCGGDLIRKGLFLKSAQNVKKPKIINR